jgi:tRNA (guanine6-N2)-methyltransferase
MHRRFSLLARTSRGIEWIAAAEIRATFDAAVRCGHREVRFAADALSSALLDLGTVDDVFLVVAVVDGIDRARGDLAALANVHVDLDRVAGDLTALRSLPTRTFDVTASFLGRRNFGRYDLEDAIGAALCRATGWTYLSRTDGRTASHRGLSLRIHLEGVQATVSVRLGPRPLHRRAYRVATQPGVLRPPLARALALLAGLRCDRRLLDPFCGVGTIAIEAGLACSGLDLVAMDVDRDAIERTRANALAAGVEMSFVQGDAAAALPFADGTVDRIATNPPWGRTLASAPESAWHELRRVLRPDGRAVALLRAAGEREFAAAGLEPVLKNRIRVSGALADAFVLVPRCADRRPIDREGLFGRELEAGLTDEQVFV